VRRVADNERHDVWRRGLLPNHYFGEGFKLRKSNADIVRVEI
jgi:hypothetical protein